MTDEELRSLMRTSPEQGRKALFDQYFNYAYTIIFRILHDCAGHEDIEECVIDTFSDVMFHYDLDYEGSLKAYIGTAAKRKAIDARRSMIKQSSRTVSLENEDLQGLPSPHRVDDTVETAEQNSILIQKIMELGEPDSIIIIQKYFYNRKSNEIAKIVKLSPAAVRMRCTRALKQLRITLSEAGITL